MGRVEDAPPGAVVALEPDHRDLGELALEVAQVLLRGAPKAVDGLVVVADHHHVLVLLDQQPQQHPWAKFVSWYSSTSTCRKRRERRSRTCGFSWTMRKARTIRSPKSRAPRSARSRSWSA